MSEWQPIETVPRDGTPALLHNLDDEGCHSYVQWSAGCGFEPEDIEATHWAELEPPK